MTVARSYLPDVASLSRRLASPAQAAWWLNVLLAFVWAALAGLLALPITVLGAAWCAALGAAAGALLAPWLASTRLRLHTVWLAGAAFIVTALLIVRLGIGSDAAVGVFGLEQTFVISECVFYAAVALTLALTLRTAALRIRLFAGVEATLLVVGAATLVIAHRNGAINRPFELADPILARGGDPVWFLFGFGAVVLAFAALLLMRERSFARFMLQIALLVVGGLGLVALMRELGPPQPGQMSDSLGLRGQPKKNEGKGKDAKGAGSGQSHNELEFKDDYDSQQGGQVPVGVVLLHDDYFPPYGVYYFRQGAFSQYNGRRLVSGTRQGVDTDIADGYPTSAAPPLTASDLVSSIGFGRVEVDTTVALLADHTRPLALETPEALAVQPNPDPSRFRRFYRVNSLALAANYRELFGRAAGAAAWSDDVRRHYLEGPADPRYAELAAEIARVLPEALRGDPMAKALAVAGWLSKQGTYSLRSRHATASDPTADFLFGDKVGYCVHFSHAAAYLLRALGVPTRVATGYAIEESARRGGSSIVLTAAAAHAWPEIYLDGAGWVIVDVVPERVLDPPPPPPDPDLQRLLGQLARGEPQMFGPDRHKMAILEIPWARILDAAGTTLAIFIVLAIVAGYAIKLGRRTLGLGGHAAQHIERAYRIAADRLAEAGLPRRYGETSERYARRLAAQIPSLAKLSDDRIRARYAPVPPTRTRHELRAQLTRVARELRSHVPLWRRALGFINPWSWLGSR